MEISLRTAVIGIIILVGAVLVVAASIVYSNKTNAQMQTQTDKMFQDINSAAGANILSDTPLTSQY